MVEVRLGNEKERVAPQNKDTVPSQHLSAAAVHVPPTCPAHFITLMFAVSSAQIKP